MDSILPPAARWPAPVGGVVPISGAQLAYLLDGIDWRLPQYTWQSQAAG